MPDEDTFGVETDPRLINDLDLDSGSRTTVHSFAERYIWDVTFK